jgi:hypothetical protein
MAPIDKAKKLLSDLTFLRVPGRAFDVNPAKIIPLHPVRDQDVFRELVSDMTENGWCGRPLLVIACAAGFQAWTGSHRIIASPMARARSYQSEGKLLPHSCQNRCKRCISLQSFASK